MNLFLLSLPFDHYIIFGLLNRTAVGATMASKADTDCYTMRPRTPNDPYSVITEEQIANLKKVHSV